MTSLANPQPAEAPRNAFLEPPAFLQIPGPNPLLRRGPEGAWDDGVIEACDVLKDFGTYYFYYHGTSETKKIGYQIGVATASHPLGPFVKHGDKPILTLGAPDSWENKHVACAMVLKEAPGRYVMWYSGFNESDYNPADPIRKWGVGLATAPHPLGPWTKYEKNPVIENFGYVGGVTKVAGKYYVYSEHPIGSTGDDYGPMSLAVGDRPEGPYQPCPYNPVLRAGECGEWDDGGISESKVIHSAGVFHLFYAGAKIYKPRMTTRESIGYAWSHDGVHFTKYGRNPVATRDAQPNAASFSEVHGIIEMPFVYLYHTLRYKKPVTPADEARFPNRLEDLGVQILVTQSPFSLDMPLLARARLEGCRATALEECPPVALSHVRRLALTIETGFSRGAKDGLVVHLRSSCDGVLYDTVDLATVALAATPGATARRTIGFDPNVRFLKVIVENRDEEEVASDVIVTATLGG